MDNNQNVEVPFELFKSIALYLDNRPHKEVFSVMPAITNILDQYVIAQKANKKVEKEPAKEEKKEVPTN